MSSQAVGWVFAESPYKGAAFALHLAIADTVNDAYENELWASVSTLAEKARLGERIVRKVMQQMVDDGLLELLSARNGHIRRYRFLMPANPCTSCTPAQDAPLHDVPQTPAPRSATPAPGAQTPARRAPITTKNTDEPNGEPNPLGADLAQARDHRRPAVVAFDEFWAVYPKRKSKGEALVAWKRAVTLAEPQAIIDAAIAYRDDPNRDPDFTKYPATWLNKRCWLDEYEPPARKQSKGTRAALRVLERHGHKELTP